MGYRMPELCTPAALMENQAMREDPVLEELHQIRRDLLSEFNGDMDAFYRHLKSIEEDERKRGRVVIDRSQHARRASDAAWEVTRLSIQWVSPGVITSRVCSSKSRGGRRRGVPLVLSRYVPSRQRGDHISTSSLLLRNA